MIFTSLYIRQWMFIDLCNLSFCTKRIFLFVNVSISMHYWNSYKLFRCLFILPYVFLAFYRIEAIFFFFDNFLPCQNLPIRKGILMEILPYYKSRWYHSFFTLRLSANQFQQQNHLLSKSIIHLAMQKDQLQCCWSVGQ